MWEILSEREGDGMEWTLLLQLMVYFEGFVLHPSERRGEKKCDQFRKKNIGQNVLTTKLWALMLICKWMSDLRQTKLYWRIHEKDTDEERVIKAYWCTFFGMHSCMYMEISQNFEKCGFVRKLECTKLKQILEINVEEVWKSNLLLLFHDNCQWLYAPFSLILSCT